MKENLVRQRKKRNKCEKRNDDHLLSSVAIGFLLFTFLIWIYLLSQNPSGTQARVLFQDSKDWFNDFFNTVFYSIGRNPYSWGNLDNRNYLPLAYLIVYPFSLLGAYDIGNIETVDMVRNSQMGALSVSIFLIFSIYMLFVSLKKANKLKGINSILLMFSLMCTSVFLYNVDRANEIILTVALINIFFSFYRSDHRLYREVACFCLAFAAVLKLFPVLFGIFLLYDKKYREIVSSFIYGIILTFLPFFWIKGDFVSNVTAYFTALTSHVSAYSEGTFGFFAPNVVNMIVPGCLKILVYIMLILCLMCAGSLEDRWKQILLVSLGIFLSTGQQAFYCLLIIFLPFVMMVNEGFQKKNIPYFVGILVILMPYQFYIYGRYFTLNNYTVTNTVCIAMYIFLLAEALVATVKSKVPNVNYKIVERYCFGGVFLLLICISSVSFLSFHQEYVKEREDQATLRKINLNVRDFILESSRYQNMLTICHEVTPGLGIGGTSLTSLNQLFEDLGYEDYIKTVQFKSDELKGYDEDYVFVRLEGKLVTVWIQKDTEKINSGAALEHNHLKFYCGSNELDN